MNKVSIAATLLTAHCALFTFAKGELDLSGEWKLSKAEDAAYTCPIAVTGGVHTALVKAGKLEDPYFGRNEIKARWVGETDWVIEREFDVSEDFLKEPFVWLRLEDCDTFCTVYINGEKVGETANRFLRYDFEVKKFLKAGKNTIRGEFDDNCVTVLPGRPVTLKFTPKCEGVTPDAFRKAFTLKHLRETY